MTIFTIKVFYSPVFCVFQITNCDDVKHHFDEFFQQKKDRNINQHQKIDNNNMDNFAVHLSTTDTKKKLSIGQDIIDYLGQPENPTDCEDLGGFIDALVPWMQSSNFKVCMYEKTGIIS